MLSTLQGAYKIYLHFEIFAWMNGSAWIAFINPRRDSSTRGRQRGRSIPHHDGYRKHGRDARRSTGAADDDASRAARSRIVGETGGWTARGAPTLLGRRRVAPATAMKKGTEDKDGGDRDATNGEVRFAELPRLREWAVQAAERPDDEGDQNLEIWNLTRACDDSEEATREYDHQEGLGPFKTWLGAIMYETRISSNVSILGLSWGWP